MSSTARSAARHPLRKFGLAFLLAASCVVSSPGTFAKGASSTPAPDTAATVEVDKLPPEAAATLDLIHRGGPFPHTKDGTVFGNRERILPPRARGDYREYTVKTPGARHRGARRIVCGGRPPTEPEACYYTGDHYASFRRIVR